jgi:septal ring factor EnvC (AmiA/AmiB activator)
LREIKLYEKIRIIFSNDHCTFFLRNQEENFRLHKLKKIRLKMALRQTTSDLAECEKKFGQKSSAYEALSAELEKAKAKIDELKQRSGLSESNQRKIIRPVVCFVCNQ